MRQGTLIRTRDAQELDDMGMGQSAHQFDLAQELDDDNFIHSIESYQQFLHGHLDLIATTQIPKSAGHETGSTFSDAFAHFDAIPSNVWDVWIGENVLDSDMGTLLE